MRRLFCSIIWNAGQPRLILKLRYFILRNSYLIRPDAVRETPDTVSRGCKK